MTHTNRSINPLYAARMARTTHQPSARRQNEPVYARLPLAPRNASPVPHLTSLYHFHRAGEYGDRSYPGNCGGTLIRDLLLFFRPESAFDPFLGSGTCADVCRELGISASTAPTSSGSATGASSSRKIYRSSFIPGLHDVCMVFEKA